jgi:hypothetical protein
VLEVEDGARPDPVAAPEGTRRNGLDEQTEVLEDEGPLTPHAEAALERADHADARAAIRAGDVGRLVRSCALGHLVDHDLVEADEGQAPRFERDTDLQRRWDRATVALYLEPFDA